MSNKPAKDKVEQLRKLLSERMELNVEIHAIRSAAERLEELEAKHRTVSRDIIKVLDEMDCKVDGNMGWEGRITWMLTELMNQSVGKASQ